MEMGDRVGKARTVVTSAIAIVTLFACFTATASARNVHVFSNSFGNGELSLSAESGIAVNRETSEVYVADTNHSRVARFTGAGSPDGNLASIADPTSIAVDNSTGPSKGDVYVVEGESTVTKLDPTGALVAGWGTGGHLDGLTEILGIAVDPTGKLWVLSQSVNVAEEETTLVARTYNQAGTLVTSPWTWSKTFVKPINVRGAAAAGLAVDSLGDLYSLLGHYQVAEPSVTTGAQVRKFDPTGETLIESLKPGENAGVTIDPSDDDVYFGTEEVPPYLFRYSPTGELVERFGGEYEGPVDKPLSEAEKLRLKSVASIAVQEHGAVDVADWKRGQISVYELEEVVPPSVTIEPVNSVTQTSAHVVGHIDPNAPAGSAPSHNVAWEFQCTPACPGNDGYIELKVDGSKRTVEATIEGLEPGTEYSVSLVAENRGGKSEAPENPHPGEPNPGLKFQTAPAPPSVISDPASEVVRGEAVLNAGINSNGVEATYHFEYMTKAAFEAGGFGGAGTIRTPESEPLPSPTMVRPVSARVGSLEPATEYAYRAVAHNSLGAADGAPVFFRSQVGPNPVDVGCPNQVYRTGAAARLPDCRAYELVSPTEKQGSPVEPYENVLQTSAAGNAVTWFTGGSATDVPSPGEAGHQGSALYLSTAGSAGWSSQRLLPPESKGERGRFLGLTEDGRYALMGSMTRSQQDPALYLLDTADQELTTMVPPQPGAAPEARPFTYDGSNEADTLFFFESRLELPTKVKGADGTNNLYMWNRETGELSLVGILPGVKNETPAGGSFGGAYSWFSGSNSPAVGGSEAGLYVGALHAIAASGDAVYFTSGASKGGASDQLFLRRGLTGAKPTTVRISVANAGVTDPNGEQPAAFQEATRSGERVFFLSSGKLTQNANTGAADEGSDLYRYDVGTKTLIDVTPDPLGAGARVQGLLGAAEDGGSGYLAAQGVLAPGGVEGEDNLYHFEEGPGGGFVFSFVAALHRGSRQEESNWTPVSEEARTARVSTDGQTLLFMSQLPLNGEQRGSCINPGGCPEVYRYSPEEGPPDCISCNPSARGLPQQFGAELSLASTPTLPAESTPIYGSLPRNLSASGTRVFFQSHEALLPEDGNGQDCTSRLHCGDVYEWEAVGSGSCRSANQAGGCLSLLSDGESDQSSYFVGASSDGDDAFIITSSQLVPVDEDALADIYDVRTEGGLSSQQVQPPEPCGSAEACKGTSSGPSSTPSPGTQSFQGPGNPKPKPPKQCKKGSVRKHGKCVKESKRRKKANQKGKAPQKKSRTAGSKHSGGKRK
jgi:hypothetical protein